MTPINQLVLECTVSHDAETTAIKFGTVTKFPVSYTRDFRNAKDEVVKEEASFDVELYGAFGQSLEALLKRGKEIQIIGRLKQDRWKGDDGKMHSRLFIVAEHIDFPKTEEESKEEE